MSIKTTNNFDYIWDEIDQIKNNNVEQNNSAKYITCCTNCESTNIETYKDIICGDCGLVLSENRISDNIIFSGECNDTNKFNNISIKSNRLSKIKEWYTWTNDEKNTYKLKEYIKSLCERLQIIESIVSTIIDKSIIVMDCVKKNDGTKRGRVKDGIIITCIHHISKFTSTPYCYIDLSNKIDLDIKYVTKAEKSIS